LVFVILDGDGAIFRDDMLYRGEDAAFELLVCIRKHIKSIYPDDPVEDFTIMVQIIVNLEGQARTLHAAGILKDGYRDLTAFAQAFGQAQRMSSCLSLIACRHCRILTSASQLFSHSSMLGPGKSVPTTRSARQYV
jgi:hypothetical protein